MKDERILMFLGARIGVSSASKESHMVAVVESPRLQNFVPRSVDVAIDLYANEHKI